MVSQCLDRRIPTNAILEEVALTSGQLTLAHVPSPLGTLLLVTDGAGQLRALDFEDHTPRLRRLLRRQVRGDVTELPSSPAPASSEGSLRAYFAGELDALATVVVAAFGTPFQERVRRAEGHSGGLDDHVRRRGARPRAADGEPRRRVGQRLEPGGVGNPVSPGDWSERQLDRAILPA